MRRPPIRVRTFILGTVLVLVLGPTLAGGAGWLIERHHQQADTQRRLNTAVAYLTSHSNRMRRPARVQGFARLLGRLGLFAQVTLVTTTPPGKHPLYVSPGLREVSQKERAVRAKTRPPGKPTAAPPPETGAVGFDDHRFLIPAATKAWRGTLITDLYSRPAPRATSALVALVSGVVVLLGGLAAAVWLAGRWMVAPLARLSAEVDKVAGGDLTIAVPRSRIGEVANIAQAVEGMTAALGETAQRRAEADEARRFFVTNVAHDLRTPLFALRGHLQAIGSRVGNPTTHLERAEARADALERLIGNLFAYTRDDYAQPALQLEAVPVGNLLREVAAGHDQTTRRGDNTFDLDGDGSLSVIVDRDRVKRALTNVLDNALRYSPSGSPVHLAWTALDESTVQISVHDHGPGIDPDLLPHVFEPGIRGSPEDGSPESGAGLGLTIAKRLLEHQHATITAHNRSGGGLLVTLVLPRAPSPNPS